MAGFSAPLKFLGIAEGLITEHDILAVIFLRMQLKLLEILACPACNEALFCQDPQTDNNGDIITGRLVCGHCTKTYRIEDSIPRFAEKSTYADSFGYQWNRFKFEQIDEVNQTRLSEQRFYSETDWEPQWMEGKWLLEAGCGSGRFLQVASETKAEVVGVDLSEAVGAARDVTRSRPNVHVVQASIYELPFRRECFDGIYSIGVIQHTPDPKASVAQLPRFLKSGGRIALTIYERRRWTMFHSKYWIRPITKRMDAKVLLSAITFSMPLIFFVTGILFRIPYLGKLFRFVIPVANYVEKKELTREQRYQWALLDTFDMLAPGYDQPQTQQEVQEQLLGAGITKVARLPNPGLNLVGEKSLSDTPAREDA